MSPIEEAIRARLAAPQRAETRALAATCIRPDDLTYAPDRLLTLLNEEREKGRRIVALVETKAGELRDLDPDRRVDLIDTANLCRRVLA